MNIPIVFARAIEYAIDIGATNITSLLGCWESQVDEHWWIAINGHDEKVKCSEGAEVPPFAMYVMFNGWPAGIVDAGGGMIAAGDLANEQRLIAALAAASKATP